MPRHSSPPSYRLHAPSGQAVVTLGGRDYYLGLHNSSGSRQEYDRLIGEWLGNGRTPPPMPGELGNMTVAQVVEQYLGYLRTIFPPRGKCAHPNHARGRLALEGVLEKYSALPADRFGPLALQNVRDGWAAAGKLSRTYINQRTSCIKHCFKWAASRELVPASVWQGLQTVEGLRSGRSKAKEPKKVWPAPEEHIEQVKAAVKSPVRALIELQLLTGARPGELLQLKPGDFSRSGEIQVTPVQKLKLGTIWLVNKGNHKTAHHGHGRVLFFGPKARAVLAPLMLGRADDAFLFEPETSWRESKAGISKLNFDEIRPPARIRAHYDGDSYRQAIQQACDALKVPRWFPYQLRHNAATRLVEQFGWDVARIVLGHRTIEMTRVYAEDHLRKAAEAIEKAG